MDLNAVFYMVFYVYVFDFLLSLTVFTVTIGM